MNERARCHRRRLLQSAAGTILGVGVQPALASIRTSPEPLPTGDLSLTHWSYDFVQQLAQAGFETGAAPGTFQGKRTVTRREFAWAIRAILAQAPYLAGRGVYVSTLGRGGGEHLKWLAQAMAPELKRAGAEGPLLEQGLFTFRSLCEINYPQGVTEPVQLPPEVFALDPLWPPDERALTEGRRLARTEWERGAVRLYTPTAVADRPELGNAIPLLPMPEVAKDPRAAQVMSAHNAEVWRLLREMGTPDGPTLAWTRDLFDLPAVWKNPGKRAIPLREGTSHTSPDGLLRAVGQRLRRLDGYTFLGFPLSCFDKDGDGITQPWLPFASELIWGPPGTAVVYVRSKGGPEKTDPELLYAYDLRMGLVLNATSRYRTSVPVPRIPRIT